MSKVAIIQQAPRVLDRQATLEAASGQIAAAAA